MPISWKTCKTWCKCLLICLPLFLLYAIPEPLICTCIRASCILRTINIVVGIMFSQELKTQAMGVGLQCWWAVQWSHTVTKRDKQKELKQLLLKVFAFQFGIRQICYLVGWREMAGNTVNDFASPRFYTFIPLTGDDKGWFVWPSPFVEATSHVANEKSFTEDFPTFAVNLAWQTN